MHSIRAFLFVVVVMLSLVACSRHEVPAKPEVIENINDLVFHEGAPLFDGMGDYHHSITTSNPIVQRYFNQGLIMDFAFNQAESIRSFRAAQKLDENCAMCFWGEALALGPNINVTSNGKALMEDGVRVQAYAAILKAIALKDDASEKERDYIDALAVRYNGDIATPRNQLDSDYVDAMRNLYQKYPEEDDAATLFAESIMTTMPWDYWLDQQTPKPLTAEVIDVLETVLERSPEHPLAIHLYIHAVEASSTPERAESVADRLLNLVPGAGHLVHMPSHIYWRIGRYKDASEANIKAAAVDEAYIAACNAQGFYPAAYYPHNIHFLWASSSMEGRSQVAIEAARKVATNIQFEMIEQFPGIEFFKTIPLLALTNFGQWDEILAEPQPPEHLAFSNGIWHYVRAIAYTRKGNLDAARTEYEKFKPLSKAAGVAYLDTIAYPATMLLQIADELVQGEIAMAAGMYGEAIKNFNIAVTKQDNLPYTEPPFWYYPTRLTLGKALLESGNAKKAEQVYRQNLENYPRNGWAMYGLIQSLEMQGKDSREMQKKFNVLWQKADVILSASRF